MNPARDRAETLLKGIGQASARLAQIQAEADAELAAVTARYQGLAAEQKGLLDALDKTLRGLMKKETTAVFAGEDKAVLTHGILLHSIGTKVTIPRTALAVIKKQGWLEAVAVVESVKRPVVEAWPEERLTVIGAKKRAVDEFKYQICEPKAKS